MPTRVQGYRDVAQTMLPFRGIAINDASNNTNAVTVYASDSGILFINEFVDGTEYTLPAVGDCKGKVFFFYDNIGQVITITGGTTGVLSGGTITASVDADDVVSGGTLGEWCIIIGDGTSYFCLAGEGDWTGG